jgi:riboflavin kinase/FMN adenylyltransferase
MDTIHFPDDARPPWLVHPVLALGNFDGLHRGHLKIIERVRRGAAEHGGTPMAMTFDPHPPRVVRPDKAPPLLMTKAQRLDALHGAGIRCVAVVRFTHELSTWDPEMFVRTVLGRLAAGLRSVGGRELSLRSRAQRQLQRDAHAGAALRVSCR